MNGFGRMDFLIFRDWYWNWSGKITSIYIARVHGSCFFGLLLYWSQPSGELFSFTCKVVSPMVGCLSNRWLLWIFCYIYNAYLSALMFFVSNSLFSTLSLSPCTALLCMVKLDETVQEQSFSSLQSSKGDRSNILQGRCQQHHILRMLHTFRAAIRK